MNQRFALLFAIVAATLIMAATFADALATVNISKTDPLGKQQTQQQRGLKQGSGSDQVKLLWQKQAAGKIGNAGYYNATAQSVYFNSGGEIAIFDTRDGTKITYEPTKGTDGSSSVAHGNGKAFVASGRYVLSYYTTTLNDAWKFSAIVQLENTPIYVASKDSIFVGSSIYGAFYRLRASNGSVVWHVSSYEAYSDQAVFSEKYNLILFGSSNKVVALNADTGAKTWSRATVGDTRSTGVFSEDKETVYFGSSGEGFLNPGGALYSLFTATGKISWQFNLTAGLGVTPLLHNGVLYFAGLDRDVCRAVNANTGKQVWSVTECVRNTVDVGFARLYRDTFLLATNSGFIAVALNGSGVVWSWGNASGPVTNFEQPTSDGKLFLGDINGKVYALQLPKSGSASGNVHVKRCTDTACSSGCVTQSYVSGQCVKTGPTSSVMRYCTLEASLSAAKKYVWVATDVVFTSSPTCDGNSAHTEYSYQINKCYQDPFAGSNELLSCDV